MSEKKVAVVTGGSRGLGKAQCEIFLERGFRVVAIARSASDWREQDEDYIYFQCDIRDREGLKKVRDQIIEKFGRVDVLVNNAGVQGEWRKDVDVLPDENWDWNVAVNMTGTFNVTKIIGSLMMVQLLTLLPWAACALSPAAPLPTAAPSVVLP
jgi:3-oxoacyl-[acyl-carrier protein] reductase